VPAAYTTTGGTRVTLTTDVGAQCPGMAGANSVVMAVAIPPGAPPVPQTLWCAPITVNGGPASPIATTTDGKNEAIVWVMSGNRLMGYDGESGAVVFNGGGASDTCTAVRRWTSPIAVKGRIVVGGDGHLCSWSPQ